MVGTGGRGGDWEAWIGGAGGWQQAATKWVCGQGVH